MEDHAQATFDVSSSRASSRYLPGLRAVVIKSAYDSGGYVVYSLAIETPQWVSRALFDDMGACCAPRPGELATMITAIQSIRDRMTENTLTPEELAATIGSVVTDEGNGEEKAIRIRPRDSSLRTAEVRRGEGQSVTMLLSCPGSLPFTALENNFGKFTRVQSPYEHFRGVHAARWPLGRPRVSVVETGICRIEALCDSRCVKAVAVACNGGFGFWGP